MSAALKVVGLLLIVTGVIIIGYQIIYPSPEAAAQIRSDIAAGGSGRSATNTVMWWPSAILILLGGGLWSASK